MSTEPRETAMAIIRRDRLTGQAADSLLRENLDHWLRMGAAADLPIWNYLGMTYEEYKTWDLREELPQLDPAPPTPPVPVLDWFASVVAFHVATDSARRSTPGFPSKGTPGLRLGLLEEEFAELRNALLTIDLPGIADGLADLIYVALGTAVSYGIDLRPVMAAVCAANATKATGERRADGKILKPPGFEHPDIAGILAGQGEIPELTGEGVAR